MPNKPPVHGQQQARERRKAVASWYDKRRGSASERGYGAAWQPIREAALLRDHGVCVKCGALVGKSGHVDHIVARSEGGTDELSNLRTLCAACHGAKTATEDGGFGNG